jgi:hypothetical protein
VKMSIAQLAQKDRPFWRNQIERILSVDRRSLFSKSLYQLPRACNRRAPFFSMEARALFVPHLFPKYSVRDCYSSKYARQFGIASSISVRRRSGCFGCSVNGRVRHSGEEKTDGLFNITALDAYNRQFLSIRNF